MVRAMRARQSILSTITAFSAQHRLGRMAFGLLAVGDRDFVRHLEVGKPITLGRIEKAEAFMERVNAEPACLPELLKAAGLEPEPRGRAGASLGSSEGGQESGEVEGEGPAAGASHGETVTADVEPRHREPFSREVTP